MHPVSEKTAQLIEEHDMEDDAEKDEGFSDNTDDLTVLDLEVLQAPASQTPDPSTITSGLGSSLASSVSTLALPAHPPLLLALCPLVCPLLELIFRLKINI